MRTWTWLGRAQWQAGMLSLGKKNEKDKKRKGSNQENFKRLVVERDRKWSELSDGERSHFLSLAIGKEERMTRRLGYKNKHLVDLDRYDDVTSSTYVWDIVMHYWFFFFCFKNIFSLSN